MPDSQDPTITLEPLKKGGAQAGSGADAVYGVRSGKGLIDALMEDPRVRMAITILALVVIALAIPVVLEIAQLHWTNVAKYLMIYFVTGTALVSLAIAILHRQILEKLQLLEELADALQEETRIQLGLVGGKLQDLNERLFDKKANKTEDMLPDFLKSLGPFAMLILKRETSLIQWGMIGSKFVKNAMDLWKTRQKE